MPVRGRRRPSRRPLADLGPDECGRRRAGPRSAGTAGSPWPPGANSSGTTASASGSASTAPADPGRPVAPIKTGVKPTLGGGRSRRNGPALPKEERGPPRFVTSDQRLSLTEERLGLFVLRQRKPSSGPSSRRRGGTRTMSVLRSETNLAEVALVDGLDRVEGRSAWPASGRTGSACRPRCTWPRTVVRASLPVRFSILAGQGSRRCRRGGRGRRRRAPPVWDRHRAVLGLRGPLGHDDDRGVAGGEAGLDPAADLLDVELRPRG